MTQEIIVDRNPLEARIWQSLDSNPDILVYIFASAVVFIASVMLIQWLGDLTRLMPNFKTGSRIRDKLHMPILFGLSGLVTYGVVKFVM